MDLLHPTSPPRISEAASSQALSRPCLSSMASSSAPLSERMGCQWRHIEALRLWWLKLINSEITVNSAKHINNRARESITNDEGEYHLTSRLTVNWRIGCLDYIIRIINYMLAIHNSPSMEIGEIHTSDYWRLRVLVEKNPLRKILPSGYLT
jgi:hypothetical protein